MRNFLVVIIVVIFVAGIIGCSSLSQVGQTQKRTDVKQPDWSKIDPLNFLDTLKEHPELPFTIWSNPPQDWIKEEHVGKLMQLIDSKEPAASVVSVVSSYLPPRKPSTVGNEAMFLIEGFKKGRYPPSLCSVYYFKGESEMFRKWWSERKIQ